MENGLGGHGRRQAPTSICSQAHSPAAAAPAPPPHRRSSTM
ncbi:MAG: hypothetical protein ACLR4Z_11600 [Butyricicoccaceae bacterium]